MINMAKITNNKKSSSAIGAGCTQCQKNVSGAKSLYCKYGTLVFIGIVLAIVFSNIVSAATINVGSGYTYTTIQSGINAASSGDVVSVHAGTYTISSSVVLKSGVTVQGAGYNSVTVSMPVKSDFCVDSEPAGFWGTSVNNVHVSGFKFKGPATSVADIRDESQTHHGGHSENHAGIRLKDSTNVWVNDNYFTLLMGDAIRTGGCSYFYFTNNQINTHGHDGGQIYSTRNVLWKNNYISSTTNCGVRFSACSGGNLTCTQNTFTNGMSNSGWTCVQIQGSTTGLTVNKNVFTRTTDNWAVAGWESSGSGCTISNNVGYSIPDPFCYDLSSATKSNNTEYGSEQNWAAMGYGYNAATTGGGGAVEEEPTGGYDGDPAVTLSAPSDGSTQSLSNGKLGFSWSNVGSTNYNIQVSTVDTFSTTLHDRQTTARSISLSLADSTTYYWRVRPYVDSTGSWGSWTAARSVTTATAAVSQASNVPTGVYGIVFDTSSDNPISGAVLTLMNDTWSATAVTNENGHYSFAVGYGTGTYYLTCGATDYVTTPYQMPVNLTSEFEEMNIALTKAPSYFQPHYSTLIVSSMFGAKYEGVSVDVATYDESTNSATSVIVAHAVTDDQGRAVVKLEEDVHYVAILLDPEQNIDTERDFYAHDDNEVFWIWGAVKKASIVDNNSAPAVYEEDDYLLWTAYEGADVNTSWGQLNQSISATGNSLISWTTVVTQIHKNGTATGNYTNTTSGSGNINLTMIVPKNASYVVSTDVVHPDFETILHRQKIIEIRGSGIRADFDFGFEDQWNYWVVSAALLFLMGGLVGMRTAKGGALMCLLVGDFCVWAGWIQPDTGGQLMIMFGHLLVIIYILTGRD